jgi:hypothetical protein
MYLLSNQKAAYCVHDNGTMRLYPSFNFLLKVTPAQLNIDNTQVKHSRSIKWDKNISHFDVM